MSADRRRAARRPPATLPGARWPRRAGEPASTTARDHDDRPSTTTARPRPAAADDAGVTDETADAFAQGWFSDDGAFAQVALWGLAADGHRASAPTC